MFAKITKKAQQGFKLNRFERFYFFKVRPITIIIRALGLVFLSWFVRDVSDDEFDDLLN